jgi:hypothetical protein
MDPQQEAKLQELLKKHRANLLLDSVRARVDAMPSGPKSLPIPASPVDENEGWAGFDTSTPAKMIEIMNKLAGDIPVPPAPTLQGARTPFTCNICARGKQANDRFFGFNCPCEVCISCISTHIYEHFKPECPLCTRMYRHHELISFLNHITKPPS